MFDRVESRRSYENPGGTVVKRSRRRAMWVTLSVLVGGMALSGNVSAEGEATAHSKASSRCPALYCLWTRPGFKGQKLIVDERGPVNMPGFMNDKASSLKSRLPDSEALFLFDAKNGNGEFLCQDGEFKVRDLGNTLLGDAISSTDVGPQENCGA